MTSWRNHLNKRSKYGNTKTTKQGKNFDSIKEANEFTDLKLLEAAREISDLQDHFPIELKVGEVTIGTLIVDYIFFCNRRGTMVARDAKGVGKRRRGTRTFSTRTPLFRWKWKHLQAQHSDWIFEIV